MAFCFRVPVALDPVKRLSVCYVVHNYDAISPNIVCRGYAVEPLLASRVPDLQLEETAVHIHAG